MFRIFAVLILLACLPGIASAQVATTSSATTTTTTSVQQLLLQPPVVADAAVSYAAAVPCAASARFLGSYATGCGVGANFAFGRSAFFGTPFIGSRFGFAASPFVGFHGGFVGSRFGFFGGTRFAGGRGIVRARFRF